MKLFDKDSHQTKVPIFNTSDKREFKINAKTVLIIEDYPSTQEALSDLLTEEGYNVCCAFGGNEAFKIIKSRKIDIVVCKNKLSKENGLLICKRIKEKNGNIDCVLLTDFGEQLPANFLKQSGIQSISQIYSGIDRLIHFFNYSQFN